MAATERLSLLIESRTTGEQEVNRLADAINRVTAASENLNQKPIKVKPPDPSEFEKFASSVKQFIKDPLDFTGDAVETFLNKLGPMGTGVLAGGAVFGFLAKEAKGAAESLAAYGAQIENISLRTGLSAKEVGQFSYAAKMANQDVTVFESAMRKLSQGLEDNSEEGRKVRQALVDVGVSAYDSSGKLRPMGDIFVQISEGLSRIEDPAKRDSEVLKLFGRAGIELLPTILSLADNLARAKQLGLGPSDEDVKRWESYHQALVTAEAQWDRFARKVKEPLAAVFTITLQGLSGDTSDIGASMVNALKSRIPKLTPEAAHDLLQKAGESGFVGGAQYQELEDLIRKQGDKRIGASFNTGIHVDTSALYGPIQAALAPMGDKGEMEQARQKLAELQGELHKLQDLNAPFSQQQEAAEKVLAQKQKIEGLEAQAKATRDLEAAERSLEAFEKQMSQKDMGPVSRIFAQRDELVKSGANAGRATDAALIGASAELAKMTAEDQKRSFKMALDAGKEAEKEWDEVYKTLDKNSHRTVTDFLEAVKKAQETARQIDNIQFGSYRSGIIAQSNRASRMAELNAGPGQEYQAIQAGYVERLNLAQKLYDLDIERAALETDTDKRRIDEAKAEADLRRETQDAEIEHELKLAELRRKGLDDYRNLATGIFDALVSGRSGGLKSFFESQLTGIARQAVGNLASMTYHSVEGHFSLPGVGTADNPSFLGKLLSGTMLGPNPLKGATDLNTMATAENTRAMLALTARMSMSPSGGGGGLYSSAASTFSKLYSGGTAAGDEGPDLGDNVYNDLVGPTGPDGGAIILPTGDVVENTTAASAASSSSFPWGKALGIAGTAMAGGFGIYNGIQQGGTRGAISATGAASGMAGGILSLAGVSGPAAPILMGLGLGLSLIPALFGDPRQERANALETDRQARLFTMPTGQDYSMDVRGRYTDYDYRGQVRTVQLNANIYALDSVSLRDYLTANPTALSAAMTSAIAGGNGDDLVGTLQQRLQ